MKIYITIFVFSILFFNSVTAQNIYQPELGNQDYQGVLKKAKQILKTNKTDSIAHYYIGFSYTKLQEPKKAIEYLLKARKNGLNIFPVQLNLAKNYVATNDLKRALEELQEGANTGSSAYGQLDVAEFSVLKDDTTFKAIRQQMYSRAFPCKANENYRKFDFWLGEWEVFAANGKGPKIAESTISLSNGDCGILENYRPINMAGGNSISYYDSKDQKWKQNWVANGRVSHFIEPDIATGATMELVAPSTTPSGKESLSRMRYYQNEDGSVRQLVDTSVDQGKNWITIFDGLYKSNKGE